MSGELSEATTLYMRLERVFLAGKTVTRIGIILETYHLRVTKSRFRKRRPH